jgi:hypothetical protein
MERNSLHGSSLSQAASYMPFAFNDKEGRKQSLGSDHQIHMYAALGV